LSEREIGGANAADPAIIPPALPASRENRSMTPFGAKRFVRVTAGIGCGSPNVGAAPAGVAGKSR
jgi:hypothetical protein